MEEHAAASDRPSPDTTGQDRPSPDTTGQDRPSPDNQQFTFTVEQAVERFAALGHSRSARSVRRFCDDEKLNARKVRTSNFNEVWLIDPVSIDRLVQEFEETIPRDSAGGHVRPRPASEGGQRTEDTRYVALLEKTVADQAEQLKTKDKQLEIKDTQIAAMLERDRETNFLIRGLQTLLGLPERREAPTGQSVPADAVNKQEPLSPTP